MTTIDRVRVGVAIVILVLWAVVVLGVIGDKDALSTVTPVAFAAAAFLFASPLVEARIDSRRTRADDDTA